MKLEVIEYAHHTIKYELDYYGGTNAAADCFSYITWPLQSGQELCSLGSDY